MNRMGNRLSKIYTRTGDKGTTGLGDGSRVDKDSLRVEAYGTVDELNSAVGFLLTADLPNTVWKCLNHVQHELFDLGGELCMPGTSLIPDSYVERLEGELDRFNEDLPPLKDFILPLLILLVLLFLLLYGWRRVRHRGYEAIIRRKAGLLLRSIGQTDDPVCGEIQLIRFGPVSAWPPDPAKRLAVLRRKHRRR